METSKRAKVHPITLNEVGFRVNRVQTNEIEFLRSKAIVVVYQIPELADYVQILRCPANLIISGGEDVLQNLEMYTATVEEETRVFRRNNFWQAAMSKPDCKEITGSTTDSTYVDSSVVTGNYTYFIRACVNEDRVLAKDQFTTRNCSRQVTQSVRHTFYGKRASSERETLLRANRLLQRIDVLKREIDAAMGQHREALAECQKSNPESKMLKASQVDAHRQMTFMASGGAIGAVTGGLVGASMAASKNWKVKAGAGVAGALVGGGLGVLAGSIATNIEAAFNYNIEGLPRDPQECYADEYQDLAAGKQFLGAKICSCADIPKLEFDIRKKSSNLRELTALHDNLYQSLQAAGADAK